MKIDSIEIKPMSFSFEPEFHIVVQYSYKHVTRLPIKYNGYLFLGGDKISTLQEYSFDNEEMSLRAKYPNDNSEWSPKAIFTAPISRFVLSKLEEKRNLDPKGDLILNLQLCFSFMEPTFECFSTRISQKDIEIPNLSLDTLVKLKRYNVHNKIIISSGDWIHDFIPIFQSRKYQVFELPIPKISKKTGELGKRINEALVSIKDMEDAKLDGDWNKVVKESRPVWELIRNKVEISALLKSDDINEQAILSFNKLIDSLFDFASKFVHKESQAKQVMSNKAGKEDAEMIYALSISIVNLIAKKMAK